MTTVTTKITRAARNRFRTPAGMVFMFLSLRMSGPIVASEPRREEPNPDSPDTFDTGGAY
jgi:hypothetical protein